MPTLALTGPALVLDDPVDTLALALRDEGLDVRRWWRRGTSGRPASPWPGGEACGTAALRLPRAKRQLEMMVHAAAGLLLPDGRLLLYGAADEGAGSAARRVRKVFESVRSVATGGRCRLLLAEGLSAPGELRTSLDDWGERFDPGIDQLGDAWLSFPGVFAHGRLDGGTALLVEALPSVSSSSRALDFGCGHGVLGAVVAAREPTAQVVFLDVDALALEATRRNVPGARTVLSDGWSAVPAGAWDVIVSNPPYHRGKLESLGVVGELVTGAAARLTPGGWLALVVQRRFPVERLLEGTFGRVEVLGDRGAWRVWRARKPRAAARTNPRA